MKIEKFLLCENPILNHEGGIYILHTREPMILAQVLHHEYLSDEERMNIERQITTPAWSRLDYEPETIFFLAIKIIPEEKFISKNPQQQADELAGIMRRMADWFQAYLIWEDKQNHDYEEEE